MRLLGRYDFPSGVPQEISSPTLAQFLPHFSITERGAVPAPTGGSAGNYLDAYGGWSVPSSYARPSGVTLGEQNFALPKTILGRSTIGTGTLESLQPGQVASMIGGIWGSGLQFLPTPTGSAQGRVLNDDGIWRVIPTGSVIPSGIALPQLGALSPLIILGRNTLGSGAVEQLTGQTVGSMIGKYAGSGMGLVPLSTGLSAGSGGNFLDDYGTFRRPSGFSLGELGPLINPRILGRSTAGTGAIEALAGPAVQSMLGLFSGTAHGLVPGPTGGTQSRFLNDGGGWTIPLASGIANAALGLMLPPLLKGRLTAGTGIPEDLTGAQVAASMLPVYMGSGVGVVPAPTGGTASGSFLGNNGTWQAVTPASGATQALMEAAVTAVNPVTPAVQQYHPGHPKFWAFVPVRGGVPTLSSSYNVSSVTDDALGQVTINLATSFSSVSWSPLATVGKVNPSLTSAAIREMMVRESGIAAGTIGLICVDGTIGTRNPVDPDFWSVQGQGDQ
jgi:hypothetical protein